ncbi:CpaF family protein [Kineosporia babensis]|uniref:Flp pilus assembly complex ATPase component TadA n=1 Tax=Kineosporia babensis TaxID=499548 RepID=A0A9X1NJB3_9ACTN|nr:ATPase, T2SS/T4P/T4SS family [Kineosporia babensis]MCD5316117.1 Flp pilus assembly complex ATPase component TadA [Kineosporia babensis]
MAARGTSLEPVRFEVVRRIQAQVAEKLTAQMRERSSEGRPVLGYTDEQRLAQSLIVETVNGLVAGLSTKQQPVPAGAKDGRLAAAVEASMFGTGPLQPLLNDPDLENLDVNGYDQVWARYAGRGRVRLPAFVDSDAELVDVFRALAAHAGNMARPWSSVHPELDLGLPGGVRVSGLLAASTRPQISIRRDRLGPQAFLDEPPRRYPDAISLVDLQTMDRQCALFLAAAVRARANIVVAGAVNAGKTTLLRAMANEIPAQERLVTIEQALELRLGRDASLHEDVVELETVLPSAEGSGGLDGADLVRRSKRMNPERLIYGEVLAGPEARAMLEAMLQGGDGSMSTIHSRDAYGAIARLIIGLGSLREPVQPATAAALIGQAVDFVVYVRKAANGRRVVSEILEVSGHQGETVSCATIFAMDGSTAADGNASSSVARRERRIPLRRAELLASHGYTDEAGERLNAESPRGRKRSTVSAAVVDPVPRSQPGGSGRRRASEATGGRGTRSRSGSAPMSPYAGAEVEARVGPADPVAIPALQLEDVVESTPPPVGHEQVHLPEDGRGVEAPLAHRHPTEPLTPSHLPTIEEPRFVRPSRHREPIIDMGARRNRPPSKDEDDGGLFPAERQAEVSPHGFGRDEVSDVGENVSRAPRYPLSDEERARLLAAEPEWKKIGLPRTAK